MKRFIYFGVCCVFALLLVCTAMIEGPLDQVYAHPDSCVVVETSHDFGEVNLGAIEYDTLTITCAADDTLYLNVAGLASPYSFVSGDGADTLYEDSTATVIYQYNPTAAGTHLDTITLGDAECAAVPVSGTGIAAVCDLSVSSIACGNIAIGAAYLDTVTITNTGGDTLILNVAGLSGDYAIDSGSGADTLLADESKNVAVSFTPTTVRAVTEATDTLVMGAASGCDSIILTATSYAPVYPDYYCKYLTEQDALNYIGKSKQWGAQVIYNGHDITAADTFFFDTEWDRFDGGKIFLQINTISITGDGGEPLMVFKMVEEGRWSTLHLQSSITDPGDTLVIADGTNSYNVWLLTGYNSTLKTIDGPRTTVFGDSICGILIPDDVSSGTIDMTGRYQKN